MDSRTQLDYALFQLTPTRTRCDLVIFSGKKSEKIASGLLEPFLSHLKSAKDQISKGGYSVMLKPTSADATPWFTKATLERFVRFVSTPEVLERFVTTEREISQIESSIELNEQTNGTMEVQGSGGDYDAKSEENPKIRLQRVLESRKAMLKKEQAMAYARALVAGFEMDYLYDLVSFGDAFGAFRLREACINFMELWKKKNDDKIWMDEVAAMQASYLGTSGVVLSGENNEPYHTGPAKSSASEGTDNGLPSEFGLQQTEGAAQLPPWANHLPHYMHNPQGAMFQQIPPYPGYIIPGMQVPPPHYPGSMPWPTNFQDPSIYANRDIKDSKRSKSFNKKKERFTKGEGDEIDQSSSGSDSSVEQHHDRDASVSLDERVRSKKQNRRSSRKVVIRNINYIASTRNEDGGSDSDSSSSDDSKYVDAGSIKQQVEAAVGSFKKQHKSKKVRNKLKNGLDIENGGTTNSEGEKKDGNWDIFQNLLMRDAESNSKDMDSKTIQVQEEYSVQNGYGEKNSSSLDKPKYASDDFLLTERSTGNGKNGVKFEGGEDFHGVVKRRAKDEELLMPSRVEGECYPRNSHFGTESAIIKNQKEEDWIVGSKTDASANSGGRMDRVFFHGEPTSANQLPIRENKRDVIVDDSFMVQSRLSDCPPQTQPKADIFMVLDTVGANQSENSVPGNSQKRVNSQNFVEPEDLSMMLGHDSAAKQVVTSWTPEMDYGNDISIYETVKSLSRSEPNDIVDAAPVENGRASKIRNGKEPGKKVAGKEPKSKAPIGSLVRSKSDIPPRSKILASGSTTTKDKAEKEEEKRKRMEELLIQRQKRIAERSAAKGVAPQSSRTSSKVSKKNPVPTKTDENKKAHKPVMRSSTIDRLAAARTTNKPSSTESKVGQNKKPTAKVKSAVADTSLKKTTGTQKRQENGNLSDKKGSTNHSRSSSLNIQGKDSVGPSPIVPKEKRSTEETLRKNEHIEDFGSVKVLHTVTSVEKRETSMVSTKDASDIKNSIKVLTDKDVRSSEDLFIQKEIQDNAVDRVAITPKISTVETNLLKTDEKGSEKKKLTFSSEVSVMDFSTSPPHNETSPELMHSRKKWNNGESSPKIPKGFRKLLLFGRRS